MAKNQKKKTPNKGKAPKKNFIDKSVGGARKLGTGTKELFTESEELKKAGEGIKNQVDKAGKTKLGKKAIKYGKKAKRGLKNAGKYAKQQAAKITPDAVTTKFKAGTGALGEGATKVGEAAYSAADDAMRHSPGKTRPGFYVEGNPYKTGPVDPKTARANQNTADAADADARQAREERYNKARQNVADNGKSHVNKQRARRYAKRLGLGGGAATLATSSMGLANNLARADGDVGQVYEDAKEGVNNFFTAENLGGMAGRAYNDPAGTAVGVVKDTVGGVVDAGADFFGATLPSAGEAYGRYLGTAHNPQMGAIQPRFEEIYNRRANDEGFVSRFSRAFLGEQDKDQDKAGVYGVAGKLEAEPVAEIMDEQGPPRGLGGAARGGEFRDSLTGPRLLSGSDLLEKSGLDINDPRIRPNAAGVMNALERRADVFNRRTLAGRASAIDELDARSSSSSSYAAMSRANTAAKKLGLESENKATKQAGDIAKNLVELQKEGGDVQEYLTAIASQAQDFSRPYSGASVYMTGRAMENIREAYKEWGFIESTLDAMLSDDVSAGDVTNPKDRLRSSFELGVVGISQDGFITGTEVQEGPNGEPVYEERPIGQLDELPEDVQVFLTNLQAYAQQRRAKRNLGSQ